MKKLLLAIIFIGIATVSLSAWEPNDLTKYPSFTKEGDWILNLGIGLGEIVDTSSDYIYIPSIRLSFDRNTPLGDRKLPFFFGGIVSYSGHGWKDIWFEHRITTGVRFGYHFNWGVDKLDTYAVTSAGWVFIARDAKYNYDEYKGIGHFLFDIDVGARYFISDRFGFWVELGYGYLPLSWFDIGISFRF